MANAALILSGVILRGRPPLSSNGTEMYAQRKLDLLNAAVSLGDLKVPLSNNLEALQGDCKGQQKLKTNTIIDD